jgi:hypothetical protein
MVTDGMVINSNVDDLVISKDVAIIERNSQSIDSFCSDFSLVEEAGPFMGDTSLTLKRKFDDPEMLSSKKKQQGKLN